MTRKWGQKPRRPIPDLRHQYDAIMAKVMAKVALTDTGCWQWQGFTRGGYGQTWWVDRAMPVTRLIYSAVHGAFDVDLDICHTCDNPSCCNPQHLWAGEHRENLKDGGRKGRLQGQWKTHCLRGHPLSGSNLSVYKDGFRKCNACQTGRMRVKYGWPEHLAYDMNIRVPGGYRIDFQTGAVVSAKGRRRTVSA